jgi:hypothetical protein
MKWFKGSLHTHTARSDGDINLEGVIHWYASRGYDWVAITDHNLGLTIEAAERFGEKHGILVVPGNEVTGTGHVVGLGITENSNRDEFRQACVRDSLQAAVDWIRAHGGVPVLAHPNWGNVFGAEVIASIRNCNLFEVHNASPDCNTFAAGGFPGTDEIWNETLNRGRRIFGVGSDDSHHYLPEKFHLVHASAHGGECATYVACQRLTVKSVLAALEAGRCVASSGPAPVKAGLSGGRYVVEIADPYPHFHYTTDFIGPAGVVASAFGRTASCPFPKKLAWLRARVFCSSGKYLWTQPVWG